MRTPFSALMQSKFFTPTFNSAIFDEPVRIYFSQVHESFALKIYFSLEDKLADILPKAKEISRKSGQSIMVMIYPTPENFGYSFEDIGQKTWMASELMGGDTIVGINGPREDEELALICETVRSQLLSWNLEFAEVQNLTLLPTPELSL